MRAPNESRVALDGGADGLDVLRRIAAAPSWLASGGHLLVETSERQAPHSAEILSRHGLIPRVTHSDDLDATVVVATRPDVRELTGRPGGEVHDPGGPVAPILGRSHALGIMCTVGGAARPGGCFGPLNPTPPWRPS